MWQSKLVNPVDAETQMDINDAEESKFFVPNEEVGCSALSAHKKTVEMQTIAPTPDSRSSNYVPPIKTH